MGITDRLLVLAAYAVLLGGAGVAGGQELARQGKSEYQIVMGGTASPPERTAAEELQSYLGRVTGAVIPVRAEGSADGGPRIVIGPCTLAKAMLPNVGWDALGSDGIVMRTVGRDLVLAGGAPRGTLNAVYTFLEDSVGCRWWTSSESYLPRTPNLTIAPLDTVYTPRFASREAYYKDVNADPAFAARLKLNGHFVEIPADYGGHERILGWCHTFYPLLPPERYFAAHPEWYSEVGGHRIAQNGQLCLTNTEVQSAAADAALEWIRKDPDAGTISISQNDCAGYCTCPNCRALAEREGSQAGPLIGFVNAVADRIHRVYPRIQVETLAYQWSRKAPATMRPGENVVVRLCSYECDFSHPMDSPANAAFSQDVRDWSRISPRLYVWDYVTNFENYLIPYPNWNVLGPNLRFLAASGATGVFEQGDNFSPAGDFVRLRAWVLAHLLWDPSRDQKELTHTFLTGYYGAAGPILERYLDIIGTAGARGTGAIQCFRADVDYMSVSELIAGRSLFAEAERAVVGDAILAARVRRERIPLDIACVLRYRGMTHAVASAGVVPDIGVLVSTITAALTEFHADFIGEGRPIAPYLDGLRARVRPAARVPDGVPDGGEWLDVQDGEFTLYGTPSLASIVDDPAASDGKAARMPGNHRQWAVQLRPSRDLVEAMPGTWRCYVAIRCQSEVKSGPAFAAGVFDSGTNSALAQVNVGLDRAGDGAYHVYDLGARHLTSTMYVWVAPDAAAGTVAGIYVDRVYFVREPMPGR